MMTTHRPCCVLFCVLSLGIILGHFLPLPLIVWIWVTCGLLIIFICRPVLGIIFAGVFALGAALIHVAHPPAVDFLLDWRIHFEESLYRYLDSTEAGTMAAIILGDRGHIPKEINMIFRHTGTGHILVIAGLHMGMMAGMVLFILKMMMIPLRWQVILAISLIIIYTLLTGGAVPVVRAAIMIGIVVISRGVELQGDALNGLGLAGIVLLLIDAANLFDIGFQLSFGAVTAIIVLCPILEKKLTFYPQWLSKILAVSAAAWLGITPFQCWHFGTITPIAIVANLFIVPLLDITVALGLSLTLTASWAPLIASSLAGCIKIVFNLMVIIAFWFSNVPFGYLQFNR